MFCGLDFEGLPAIQTTPNFYIQIQLNFSSKEKKNTTKLMPCETNS